MTLAAHDLSGYVGKLHSKKRPVIRVLVLATTLACLLLNGLAAWFIWSARETLIRERIVATSNVARMVGAQVESAMKVTSLALHDVVGHVEQEGTDGRALDRIRAHLTDVAARTPELQGLFIYGADGAWIVTSLAKPVKGNNADREYFKHHRDDPGRGIFIGHPIKSRSTGAWIVPVSRRIDAPDGSFAGVALVTLRIDFFEQIYNDLDIGKTGAVLLAMEDGTAVYRRPFDEKIIGSDLSTGSIFKALRGKRAGSSFLLAKVDNVERLYSYRRVDHFPFYVAFGLAKHEILDDWRRTSIWVGITAVLINVVFAVFAKKLSRQIVIRDKLDEKLRDYSEQLRQHNLDLQILADTDKLTKLANRRRFDEVLEQEFKRAQRSQAPVSLIMMDLDYFKQFNDLYGHPAGDACLRGAARALSALIIRAGDLAARYGGEEFVILLPNTDHDGALAVAEKIRAAIEALQVPHRHSPAGVVTASLGVATMTDPRQFAHAGNLVEAADKFLYAAKQAGRNTVCSA